MIILFGDNKLFLGGFMWVRGDSHSLISVLPSYSRLGSQVSWLIHWIIPVFFRLAHGSIVGTENLVQVYVQIIYHRHKPSVG